jgi:hypothetical protein
VEEALELLSPAYDDDSSTEQESAGDGACRTLERPDRSLAAPTSFRTLRCEFLARSQPRERQLQDLGATAPAVVGGDEVAADPQ